MADECSHLDQVDAEASPRRRAARTACATAARWVHLRMCRVCGHVGCCDSSPNKHATAHFHATGHPLVSSYEPGEDWWWCYADDLGFLAPELPTYSHP